ncbi:MAG: Gfo/Idh/MocA family oxidoreductase [Armatimonadota bacterium]
MEGKLAQKTLRVAVIGMGHIGSLHTSIYKDEPLCETVGVCDRISERAEAGRERFGVPCFLSAQEMLDSLKPDVVSVATGGYEYCSDHYEPTMQALEAGCHVLCEKPISDDLAHAAEMVSLAKERGLCFALDFNHRFTPAARIAKSWLDEGRLGELLFVNMALWIGRPQDEDSEVYHLKALNPHSIDMIRHFCGNIMQVQCFGMKASGRTMWSTTGINLKLENGMVGHLTSSYDIGRGHPMERCEVAGVDGRFVLEDMWREATLYPTDTLTKQVYTNPVFGGFGGFDDTFRERLHTFVVQVFEGVSPDQIDGTGEDGLEAQRVIHAAIASLKTGSVVAVADIQ